VFIAVGLQYEDLLPADAYGRCLCLELRLHRHLLERLTISMKSKIQWKAVVKRFVAGFSLSRSGFVYG
jgi:hypothetical protein